jgi:hypothetical protein
MNPDQKETARPIGVLVERLSGYWRLEALNVFLVPVAVLVCVYNFDGRLTASLVLSLAANCLLLSIGACYWRIVHLQLLGSEEPFKRFLPWLARLHPLALASVAVSVFFYGLEIVGVSQVWTATEWAMTGVTLLAVLEYVNYYHWQLQYFDHKTDFVALLKTRRLKRAHMARAIRRWKDGAGRL